MRYLHPLERLGYLLLYGELLKDALDRASAAYPTDPKAAALWMQFAALLAVQMEDRGIPVPHLADRVIPTWSRGNR